MKNKRDLCRIRDFKIVVIFLFAFFAFAEMGESQNKDESSIVHIENGVVFKGEKVLFIDFKKLDYPELNLSDDGTKKTSDEILKNSIIDYTDDGTLHVFDSKNSDRYAQIIETEKSFTYKIKGRKAFVYNKAGDRSLLKVLFVKTLKAPKETDDPYYPCMVLYLECKWFQGNYEIQCE